MIKPAPPPKPLAASPASSFTSSAVPFPALIPALILAAALSACASGESSRKSGPPNDPVDRKVFQALSQVFDQFQRSADKIWTTDYRLDRMPILLVREEQERDLYGFLINHPAPGKLGGVPENIPGSLGLPTIYRLNPLPKKNRIAEIAHFTFSEDLGGTDTFILKYSEEDFSSPGGDFDSAFMADNWRLYLVHETFHTFQFQGWNEKMGNQDTAGYPLDAMHLALIMMETAALRAAVDSRDERIRTENTQMFIAVREERMKLHIEVEYLDLLQEQIEGTAKYVEHRMGSLLGFEYTNLNTFASTNFMAMPEMPESRIRSHAAFGRFYGTGAAICRLLDNFAVKDWKTQVTNGLSPYEVLRDRFALNESDLKALLASAKEAYGFSCIQGRAEKAAARAAEESTNIWDDESF